MHLFLYILSDTVAFVHLSYLTRFLCASFFFFLQPSLLLVFYARLLICTCFASSRVLFPQSYTGKKKQLNKTLFTMEENSVQRLLETRLDRRRGETFPKDTHFFMRCSLFSLESRLSVTISTTRLKSGES